MQTHLELQVVQAFTNHVISSREMQQRIGGLENYVRVQLPANIDAMVMSLVALFAAENIQNTVITYPRDWWEAVKERFFPRWALNRWPAIYTTQTVDIKAIWKGYKAPLGMAKYGPFLPYVHQTTQEVTE